MTTNIVHHIFLLPFSFICRLKPSHYLPCLPPFATVFVQIESNWTRKPKALISLIIEQMAWATPPNLAFDKYCFIMVTGTAHWVLFSVHLFPSNHFLLLPLHWLMASYVLSPLRYIVQRFRINTPWKRVIGWECSSLERHCLLSNGITFIVHFILTIPLLPITCELCKWMIWYSLPLIYEISFIFHNCWFVFPCKFDMFQTIDTILATLFWSTILSEIRSNSIYIHTQTHTHAHWLQVVGSKCGNITTKPIPF